MTRTPLTLPGKTVIFDYGDVISQPQSAADRKTVETIAAIDEGTVTAFWRSYNAHRDGLDRGTTSVISYWRAIAADVNRRWLDPQIYALWAADVSSWLSVNPATIEVLEDLRDGGTRLALLSNAGRDFGGFFRCGPLGTLFADCYVSGELGLLKPDADIYQYVLADLGISGAEAVFIDNRETNVAGAQAVGITGHVFTGAIELRAFLTRLAR